MKLDPRSYSWRICTALVAGVCACACDRAPKQEERGTAVQEPLPLVTQPVAPTVSAAPPAEPPTAASATATGAQPAPAASVAKLVGTGNTAPPTSGAGSPRPKASEASAAVPAPAASVETAPVAGDSFSVWMQSAKSYDAGKPGAVTAVLSAKDPYHCNEKYPYKFTLDPAPAGVTYPQPVVRGMRVGAKRSDMSIPFVASQPGKANISGELAFSVCTAEKCLIEKRRMSVSVNVK
jgi:hypothetical protein